MRGLYFILILSGIFSSYAQETGNKIYWQEDPLTWKDFQAVPVKSSSYQANTNAGLSFSWGIRSENGSVELHYEVLSYFNPHLSWVVPASRNDYLLKHEQLHFDITELHARKLRRELANISVEKLGKNAKEVLNAYYEKMEKQRDFMQKKYDRETNHSINQEAEAKWQKFIRTEMNKLRDYQATGVDSSLRAASNSAIISLTI